MSKFDFKEILEFIKDIDPEMVAKIAEVLLMVVKFIIGIVGEKEAESIKQKAKKLL